MKWNKHHFELGAARLHAQCVDSRNARDSKPKRSLALNASELRYLSQLHSVADGIPIDKDSDIEIYMTFRSKCYHVIVTTDDDIYKDGWLVNSVPKPDIIHRINQHECLTNEAIQRLYKQFDREKNA